MHNFQSRIKLISSPIKNLTKDDKPSQSICMVLSNDNGASYYIMTKKRQERASADVGLMYIAYNLRRIINILDADILKKFFQELTFFIGNICPCKSIPPIYAKCNFSDEILCFLILPPSYPLKLDYICSRMGVLRRTAVIGNGNTTQTRKVVNRKGK